MNDDAVHARIALSPRSSGPSRATEQGPPALRRGGSASIHVLIVEPDAQTHRLLRSAFVSSGYRTCRFESHARGAVAALNRQFDLIVVGVSGIGCDGMDLIRAVRAARSLPVLALAPSRDEAVTVEAFECGADDCLAEPFGTQELLARSRSLLRRRGGVNETGRQPYAFGRVRVNLDDRWATFAGVPIHLTRIEFRLLECLLPNANKTMTHGHLLREVWGASHIGNSHYLHVFMRSLRRKLEPEPSRPKHLVTEIGVGYRFVA